MTELRFSPQLRTHIASQLSGFDRQTTNREDLRKAAVAVVIAPCAQSTEASVLVTMRPEMLNRHGGQYALPGGRLDAGETDVQAALRELDEELGLRVAEKDVLGALDDFPTRSGFRIAPLVMWVDDLSHMRPDPGEVASVHHLTFSELSSPDIPRLTENDVGDHPVHRLHVQESPDQQMQNHIGKGQHAKGPAEPDQVHAKELPQRCDAQPDDQKLQRDLTVFMFQRLDRVRAKPPRQREIEEVRCRQKVHYIYNPCRDAPGNAIDAVNDTHVSQVSRS